MRSSVIIDQHRRKEVRTYENAVRDRKALSAYTNITRTPVVNNQSIQNNPEVSLEAVKRTAKVSLARLRPRNTQVRRRCVVTGRGNGVLRRFRLSRIKARENVLRGEFACARKRTW